MCQVGGYGERDVELDNIRACDRTSVGDGQRGKNGYIAVCEAWLRQLQIRICERGVR